MSVAINNNVDSHEEHHHHKETFISKWIFSQDHKMIAKQYFVTGVIVMGIIGVLMSLLFRIQLGWPEESFQVFKIFLGAKLKLSLIFLFNQLKKTLSLIKLYLTTSA